MLDEIISEDENEEPYHDFGNKKRASKNHK